MKIAILGYSGSGKSTLAGFLGKRYQIPVLYLDTVQFLPGWKERGKEEARARVTEFMEQPQWVIDGNYSSFLQKRRLDEADQILYLSFNRFSCFYRGVKRYFQFKSQTRETMADGCIEKFDWEFAWWILHKGRTKKRKQDFQILLNQYGDKTRIIKNQRQLDRFMKEQESGIS